MKKNTKIIIGIVSIVIIACVAVVLVFMSKSKEKSDYDKHLTVSQKYVDDLDYERAIAELELAIEIDPNNAKAYLALADVYAEKGDYDSAISVLEEAKEKVDDVSEIKIAAKELKNKVESKKQPENNDAFMEMDELNSYLSFFSRYELHNYSVKNPDYLRLLTFVFLYMESEERQKLQHTETHDVANKSDIDEVVMKYFDITIPEQDYDIYTYANGTFSHPMWDWGLFATPLSIAEKVEINDQGNYVVEFTNFYVDFDGIETGEVNPTTLDDYYKYDIEKVMQDRFCEIRQRGKCEIKKQNDKYIMLEYSIFIE